MFEISHVDCITSSLCLFTIFTKWEKIRDSLSASLEDEAPPERGQILKGRVYPLEEQILFFKVE